MTSILDTRQDVLDALRVAASKGERDLGNGGVTAETIASYIHISTSTTSDHLMELIKEDKVVKVWGFAEWGERPRPSYLPADHPDVSEDEDEEVRRAI